MKPSRQPSLAAVLALDLFYALFTLLAWPILLVLFLAKKKWREGLVERLGFVPKLAPHPQRLWVHAISVGETDAAQPLVKALREMHPQAEIVVSTTTRTGRARAQKLFPDLKVFHYPIDFPWSVWLCLRRVKPAAIIEVEPEWWPSFLFQVARRRIPLAVVNVRITEKGVRGYQRIGRLFQAMVNCASVIGTQNEEYRARLAGLGADAERLAVTGQMKFDNVSFAPPAGTDDLARDLDLAAGERVIVAGSTGPGEEEILLDAYAKLKARFADLRLAIVPRKPERFDEVAQLITARGYALVRRSATKQAPASNHGCATEKHTLPGDTTAGSKCGTPRKADSGAQAIILGDTMGELMKFYQLGCVAFVGRSLVPLGGSNPIDPASLGLPIVCGPHMFNFPDAEELFLPAGGALFASDADSLAKVLGDLLQSPEKAVEMGRRAREAVKSRQGATARTMAVLESVMAPARK